MGTTEISKNQKKSVKIRKNQIKSVLIRFSQKAIERAKNQFKTDLNQFQSEKSV